MSDIKIQINSKVAVDKLIDGDEGLQIQIKNAIVNALTKKAEAEYESLVTRSIHENIHSKYFERGSGYQSPITLKSAEHKKAIKAVVLRAIDEGVTKITQKCVADYDFEKVIQGKVNWLVEHEIDRRVQLKFEEALKNIK
jgi:hypothetical protein